MCLLFFVKVRQKWQVIAPTATDRRCRLSCNLLSSEYFSNRWKNVGYYSRPSETKKSCVNSRFSQTRIIVIDMRSFCMFSCGKCPYIDGVKHKYCSDNSAVKHICNQWLFFRWACCSLSSWFNFFASSTFPSIQIFPKVNMHNRHWNQQLVQRQTSPGTSTLKSPTYLTNK